MITPNDLFIKILGKYVKIKNGKYTLSVSTDIMNEIFDIITVYENMYLTELTYKIKNEENENSN